MVLLQVCWSLHSWASVSTAGSVEKAACACMVLMTYGSRRWVVVFIFSCLKPVLIYLLCEFERDSKN